MYRAMLFLAAFALLLTSTSGANPANAHGTIFRGPAGEVPPGQRDPKDPQPPPENPPTPTPAPGNGAETPPPDAPSGDGGPSSPDTPRPPPPPKSYR